jgi:hypothetical protein
MTRRSGGPLTDGSPRYLQPRKIFKRPCCDHGEAIPVAGVLTRPLPGAGKSMLARRLTTMLPAMSLAEAIETTRIPRVAGRTGDRTAWVTTRLRHTSTTLPAQP